MSEETPGTVSLTSQWFIRPGYVDEVKEAVKKLAADIAANEPDTLTYLVHIPWDTTNPADALQSLPPTTPTLLLFFETYRGAEGFRKHVQGPQFKQFVKDYGHCFISSDPLPDDPGSTAGPYSTVQFFTQVAGFADGQPRKAS
jgi:uncharacterized protein